TLDFVFIKFYIRYNNSLKGYTYRYPLIYRKALSELYLLKLHYKIRVIKGLLGEEDKTKIIRTPIKIP
ncbi:uncharacterized protein N7500_008440, partial [Penicillium coprophilum]|uniref:uncharacterized protein n=1 Tax=Penicillium coprophilum TaxID=36646 RepID=UPI0023A3A985